MNPLPTKCPLTGGPVIVTRIYCPDSGITMEGEFAITLPFAQLTDEQLRFVEVFVRCEGKLNRMETELDISYPTIRTRLHEVIRAMGHEPGRDETRGNAPTLSAEARRKILQDLEAGKLSFDEAMEQLQGGD
jgi:hypothetical protein